jgi:hypothetical protein
MVHRKGEQVAEHPASLGSIWRTPMREHETGSRLRREHETGSRLRREHETSSRLRCEHETSSRLEESVSLGAFREGEHVLVRRSFSSAN